MIALSTCETSWQAGLLQLLQKAEENRNYYLAILNSPACAQAHTRFREYFSQLLLGPLTGDSSALSAREVSHARAQVSIIFSVLDQWGRGQLDLSPEEIICFVESLLASAYGRPSAFPAEKRADGNADLYGSKCSPPPCGVQ